MNEIWLGIDFSGNRSQWNPGVKRSNIWIANLHEDNGEFRLASLLRPQELAGSRGPFERLCVLLKRGDFDAAAIDAPFSIPQEYLPPGGHKALIEAVREKAKSDPPFPRATWLVAYATGIRPLATKKPHREAERLCNVNVRSTLWAGPRGGAAFTSACLCLIGQAGRPCWPWQDPQKGILVEAFPAAQLKTWNLPYESYGKPEHWERRKFMLSEIETRFRLKAEDGAREDIITYPDALDALVCCFAARAVIRKKLAPGVAAPQLDGCIALHE
jgi:hypothetical protein